MANHAARRAPQDAPKIGPLEDRAPRSRVIFEYDIPDQRDEDNLHAETTLSFGSIRSIGLKLLTPLEERDAARAASGDPLLLAFELARRSVGEVTNENGETIKVHNHDATSDELWAQVHPKIRSLVMQAYSENASPKNVTSTSFLASRRIKA